MSVLILLRRRPGLPQGGLEPGRQSAALLAGLLYFDGTVRSGLAPWRDRCRDACRGGHWPKDAWRHGL